MFSNSFLVLFVAAFCLVVRSSADNNEAPNLDGSECSSFPCSQAESGECRVYNSNGCSQCKSGYFKIADNYPCISCDDTFGDECRHCANYNGCQQCSTGYDRTAMTVDNSEIIYYCKENDCGPNNQPYTHCKVCNNGECSQCMNNYFKSTPLENDKIFCIECDTSNGGGNGCRHCADNNGCQQCRNGFTRKWQTVENNGMTFEYYRCVPDSTELPTEMPVGQGGNRVDTPPPTEEPTEEPNESQHGDYHNDDDDDDDDMEGDLFV